MSRAVLRLPMAERDVLLRYIASRLLLYAASSSPGDIDNAMRILVRELILRMALQDIVQDLLLGDRTRSMFLSSSRWSVEEDDLFSWRREAVRSSRIR